MITSLPYSPKSFSCKGELNISIDAPSCPHRKPKNLHSEEKTNCSCCGDSRSGASRTYMRATTCSNFNPCKLLIYFFNASLIIFIVAPHQVRSLLRCYFSHRLLEIVIKLPSGLVTTTSLPFILKNTSPRLAPAPAPCPANFPAITLSGLEPISFIISKTRFLSEGFDGLPPKSSTCFPSFSQAAH